MKHLFASSLALSLAIAAAGAWGRDNHPSVDVLYERGAQEAAPNWRGLGKTHNAAVFVHHDIRKSGNAYLAVWTDHELPAPEYFQKEKAYLSTRERVLIDCKAMRIGITNIAYYAEHFGKGEIVATSKTASPDMEEVIPDSLEDQLVRTACAPKPRPKPVRKAKPAKAPAAN